MTNPDRRPWQPDVTVATVVVDGGRLLCVEEHAEGSLVLNQPAGHLEPDESLEDAARRETLEETGWHVRLTGMVGIYQWRAPPRAGEQDVHHYMRVAFAAEPLRHEAARPLDDGIVRALWLTPEELLLQSPRHRSPLVWRTALDFLEGARYPLSLLRHLA